MGQYKDTQSKFDLSYGKEGFCYLENDGQYYCGAAEQQHCKYYLGVGKCDNQGTWYSPDGCSCDLARVDLANPEAVGQ